MNIEMTHAKKYAVLVLIFVGLTICYLYEKRDNRSSEALKTNYLDGATVITDTTSYWDSIRAYEKYIFTLEDDKYGYKYNAGYPLYLATIGSMYLQLYKKTHNGYYRNKFDRVVAYILSSRNDNWTWDMSDLDAPNSLYNSFFASLLLDAYQVTGEKIFLNHAKRIVESFDKFYVGSRLVTVINNREYETYNPNFFAFTTICYYCDLSNDCPKTLLDMGRNLFLHSMKGYHRNSGLWEYDTLSNTRFRKYLKYLPHRIFYSSHDAFYELLMISSFLERKTSINKVYPDLYAIIYAELPTMVSGVKKYMLHDIGSFDYDSEAPRCVECCADTAFAFNLIDQELKTDNKTLIHNSLSTIIGNQDESGIYRKSDGSKDVLLWYSDNIADKLPKLLNNIDGRQIN